MKTIEKGTISVNFVIRHRDGSPVLDEKGREIRKVANSAASAYEMAVRYGKHTEMREE